MRLQIKSSRLCKFLDTITSVSFALSTMKIVDNTELDSQLILSEAVYNDSFVIFQIII